MQHLLSIADVSTAQIEEIFSFSADLKAKLAHGQREAILPGRTLALLFEKQSLRTRVSFESAMIHLGGASMMLGEDVGFGKRESMADFSRVLSAMVDAMAVRAKQHATLQSLAQHASCPVINALTDQEHPCQALADLFTLQERFGKLAGQTLAWIGDCNNVAHSLALACGRMGVELVVSAPSGYEFSAALRASINADVPQLQLTLQRDPRQAVTRASAVYTDVWASMGQEAQRDQRRRDFADYQVNAALMRAAPAEAVFMHCLPARRGEEVTDDVIDSPASIVVDQAANRMHVQKGVLAWLLTGGGS